jgi:hypothetical protein
VGASNALAAYRLYASRVTPLAMSTLAYMALVSIDADTDPWFSLGAEMITVMAHGRPPLAETGDADEDAKAKKAMEHACERALKPLFEAGAITTARHSSGHPDRPRHARYRLWLTAPAPDEARDPRHRSDRSAPHGKRGVQNPGETTAGNAPDGPAPHEMQGVPGVGAPRNPYSRPTECVTAPHEIRGAKEYEEYEERSKTLEEHSPPSSESVPVRAREARNGPEGVSSVRMIASPLMTVVPPAAGEHCQYGKCGAPAESIGDDGYHDRCRYLNDIKARAAKAREHPEAS